jgi:hypothetical protein
LVYQGRPRVTSRARMQQLSLEQVAQHLSHFYEQTISTWKLER